MIKIISDNSEVTQLCPTLCHPMDCIAYQALQCREFSRQLEWVAISFFRGSSQPRDQTRVSRTAGKCFTV